MYTFRQNVSVVQTAFFTNYPKEKFTMQELWTDLEHQNSNMFMKEDFEYLQYYALAGLRKRHGDFTPTFHFIRGLETFTMPDGEHRTHRIPRLTVCYLRNKEKTFVGLAFCSSPDNPSRWYGKALALKRAVQCATGRNLVNHEQCIRENTQFIHFLKDAFNGSYCLVKSFEVSDPFFTLKGPVEELNNDSTSA